MSQLFLSISHPQEKPNPAQGIGDKGKERLPSSPPSLRNAQLRQCSKNTSLYLSLALSVNQVLVLPQVENFQLQFVTGCPMRSHCPATWLSWWGLRLPDMVCSRCAHCSAELGLNIAPPPCVKTCPVACLLPARVVFPRCVLAGPGLPALALSGRREE